MAKLGSFILKKSPFILPIPKIQPTGRIAVNYNPKFTPLPTVPIIVGQTISPTIVPTTGVPAPPDIRSAFLKWLVPAPYTEKEGAEIVKAINNFSPITELKNNLLFMTQIKKEMPIPFTSPRLIDESKKSYDDMRWVLNGLSLQYFKPKEIIYENKTLKYTDKLATPSFENNMSRLVGTVITYYFVNSLTTKLLSKIPGVSQLAQKALTSPWKIGYPLSLAMSGATGGVVGGISYAKSINDRLKNIGKTAGMYILFTAITYPLVQFFKPVFTKEGEFTLYPKENSTKLSSEMTKLVESKSPLYFRSPTDPNMIIKITPTEAIVGTPDSFRLAKGMKISDFAKIDIEIFKENPSLYSQLKSFIAGKLEPAVTLIPPTTGSVESAIQIIESPIRPSAETISAVMVAPPITPKWTPITGKTETGIAIPEEVIPEKVQPVAQKITSPVSTGKIVKIYHISPEINLEKTGIDPNKAGTNYGGISGRSYYINTETDSLVEPFLLNSGNIVYEVKVPMGKIWNVDEKGKPFSDIDLKKAGWIGVEEKGTIAIFEPMMPRKIGTLDLHDVPPNMVKNNNFQNYMTVQIQPIVKEELAQPVQEVKAISQRAAKTPTSVEVKGAPPGTYLNIGYNTNQGTKLTLKEIKGVLKEQFDIDIIERAILPGKESALVAQISRPLNDAELLTLTQTLRQDAIPQLSDGIGKMYDLSKDGIWGIFNPEYFRGFDGKPIISAQPVQKTPYTVLGEELKILEKEVQQETAREKRTVVPIPPLTEDQVTKAYNIIGKHIIAANEAKDTIINGKTVPAVITAKAELVIARDLMKKSNLAQRSPENYKELANKIKEVAQNWGIGTKIPPVSYAGTETGGEDSNAEPFSNYVTPTESTETVTPIPAGMATEIRSKVETPEGEKNATNHIANLNNKFLKLFESFRFYPNLSPKTQNDIRLLKGDLGKIKDKVYDKISTALWGGLDDKQVAESVKLVYARDALSRTNLDKGDPSVTVEEIQEIVNNLEKNISPEALKSAESYRTISEEYKQNSIERGLLDPEDTIEDYARHYVLDYTPDWVFNKGIPTRLRNPYRGYLKQAKGSSKEIRMDADAILGQFLEVDYDNMIQDFITKIAEEYDITPTLTEEQKTEMFGVEKSGKIRNSAKPGRIYIINNERYRGLCPSSPFTRQIFPTEEGLMALGRYKKTYLVPEVIDNIFRDFSEKGSRSLYLANRIVGLWKSMAITSHFGSFNINNMTGDTWMTALQCPEPLRFSREIPVALNYLSKRPETFNPYMQRLNTFIQDNDIVGATFMHSEAYRIRGTPNPIYYLLEKTQHISQFRESIIRTAYASYLLKGQEAGRGADLVKVHNWINTVGLDETHALGKIARDFQADYEWTSKGYNRLIRGLAVPFGTWYLKISGLVWKYTAKHLAKAVFLFLSLPILAVLWNRRKKYQVLEQKLSDGVRERIHFILRENPDGTIRVWMPQLPQDVLIGTKIYSIAVSQAGMVISGEKTIKEAAIDTLKDWGTKEIRGITFLLNPMIRYITGLVNDKDPYDNMSMYPIEKEKLSPEKLLYYRAIFLGKVMVPYLSQYLGAEVLGKPIDLVKKDIVDKFIGKGMLGIYDISPQDEVMLENGKVMKWDDYNEIKGIANQETFMLATVENRWINSGLTPIDFIKTKEFQDSMLDFRNLWTRTVPGAKDLTVADVAGMLGLRLANSLGEDISSAQKWYKVQLQRATSPEEITKLRDMYTKIRQENLISSINRLSGTARDAYFSQP